MTPAVGIEVRLACTAAEIVAAQRLRYRVFYEECGAHAGPGMREGRRDIDAYDATMDHLIVIDHGRSLAQGQVVGTYRLLRGDRLGADGLFYSSAEFDLRPLLASGQRLLELGRSCVMHEYRAQSVLQLLWRAIAGYVADHGIELMFGCASLPGSDAGALREQLAYLHHYHLAPLPLRPGTLVPAKTHAGHMALAAIDPVRAKAMLGPLIKGYLRLGAWVGDGVYVDHQFNTVDICIVMPTARLTRKYRRHYERVIERQLPGAHIEAAVEAVDTRLVSAG